MFGGDAVQRDFRNYQLASEGFASGFVIYIQRKAGQIPVVGFIDHDLIH
jgi:hypothetical protein